MRAALVPLVLLATLAGCVTPGALDAAAPVVAALPPVPLGFDPVCPEGGTQEGALCVARIVSRTESLQEPYLAVDPYRPGVMAIGVNGGQTTRAASAKGVDVVWTDVFVTEDGGKSWRLSKHPLPPVKGPLPLQLAGGAGDPALAFDEHGVLHLSGIVTSTLVEGFDIYYTSTPDLGKTWTDPVVLTATTREDRNWLTVAEGGLVLVPWQTVGESVSVAWSLDGGKTWAEPATYDDCITVSEALVVGDEVLLACAALADDELKGIDIIRLDPAAGTLTQVARVEAEDTVWPQLRRLADGRLLLYAEAYGNGGPALHLRTSPDGGRTWSVPLDVRDLTTLDDAWTYAEAKWVAVDPWGAVHVLLGGAVEAGALFLAVPLSTDAAHLVLAPDLTTVLSETRLDAATRPTDTVGPEYGDHYWGLGFTRDAALLVWTEDRTLALTAFAPRLPGVPASDP